jgi:O-antigen/teichoic acid export membrane protein
MKLWRALGLYPTIWLTFEKFTQQAIWLLLFMILAPILGPKPYGLFTIVMAFIGLCETVIVGATVESLVTIPDATDSHLRTANVVTVIAAVVAGGAVFAAAFPMATFFDAPDLKHLFRVLASLPVISALTATPIAVLTRRMQFRALATRSITGLLAGGVVAVCFAWYGAGVWALVAQVLTQRCTELAILWASAHTRLGFEWSQSSFLDLRGYAISVVVSKGMAWSGSQIPRIILGWYLGPTDLGLFALAGRIVDFVTQVVIVPQSGIARLTLRQFADEPPAFAEAFKIVVCQIAILSFPICCGLAAILPTLFGAFLDQRWQAGIPAAQLMVLTGIPLTYYYCFTAAALAARRPHLDSQVAIAVDATSALAVLLAAPHGLYAACTAMLAQRIAMLPAPLIMLRRVAGISPIGLIWAQLPVLSAAAVMGWIVFLSTPLIQMRFGHSFTAPVLIVIGAMTYIPLALLTAPQLSKLVFKRALTAMNLNPTETI